MSFWFDLWGFIRQDFKSLRSIHRRSLSEEVIAVLLHILFFAVLLASVIGLSVWASLSGSIGMLWLFIPAILFEVFLARFTKWYGDKHRIQTMWDFDF